MGIWDKVRIDRLEGARLSPPAILTNGGFRDRLATARMTEMRREAAVAT